MPEDHIETGIAISKAIVRVVTPSNETQHSPHQVAAVYYTGVDFPDRELDLFVDITDQAANRMKAEMKDAKKRVFFIATDGNDGWSGTLAAPSADGTDGPFATLMKAREAIRRLKATTGLQESVEVQVRRGTYYLCELFLLSAGDSGTARFPITYMAYPGEKPVLSGGRQVTDWQSYRNKIVCADLPDVRTGRWWFRQLFYNGRRMIRARYPKYDHQDPLYGGWAFVDAPVPEDDPNPMAFRYEAETFPRRWAKPRQTEVFIIPGLCWINDIIPVREVDFENHIIRLMRPVGPTYNTLAPATAIRTGNRFYVENVLEELSRPGEWCLDTDTGTLYFWPPDGAVESGEVVAPVTGRLIQMIGSAVTPVSHIRIQGFTLTQTLVEFPMAQSYYKTPNAGQAVYMENCEDCVVEKNFFDAVGGDAIRLQQGNARNRIVGNEIAYSGAYGIFLGSLQRGFARHDTMSGDIPSPSEWHDHPEDRDTTVKAWPRSTHHLISNNHIHHVGVFEKHAQGIAMYGISAVDVIISHNLIHHTPRFGIGMMSGFGRVIIEYNELHHLSLETSDTGGICSNRWYTYGKDPDLCRGNIIRFNRIYDIIGCGAYDKKNEPGGGTKAGGRIWAPYYGWAIYFDNAPMNVLVYGNICARNTLGGIMISHYCRNVTVENNIFVDSNKSQVYLLLAGDMANIRFRKNIFSYASQEADFLHLNIPGEIDLASVVTEFDANLFFNATGKEITCSGLPAEASERTGKPGQELQHVTMPGWRKMGYDEHSPIADPKFVDPEHDNYDLEPESPAFALGFRPVESSRIGLLSVCE